MDSYVHRNTQKKRNLLAQLLLQIFGDGTKFGEVLRFYVTLKEIDMKHLRFHSSSQNHPTFDYLEKYPSFGDTFKLTWSVVFLMYNRPNRAQQRQEK